jgi:hypothetical protein
MIANNRKIAFALTWAVAVLAHGKALASQPPCYPDIPSYMAATFGPAYQEDENLIIKERQYGKQTFTMVADMTPGTNIVRTLFRHNDKDGYCMVLKTLPMAQLKVTKTDKAGVPLEFLTSDQAPGTEPGNEIIYTLAKSKVYTPTSCKKVSYKGAKPVKKDVPCSAIPDCVGAS